MRLWSLHPQYLDRQGLAACWREALLAQAVLAGQTRGYKSHPQLDRFKVHADPLAAVGAFLRGIQQEATRRGYRYDSNRILCSEEVLAITVTSGQLLFERNHLITKLLSRNPQLVDSVPEVVLPHPLFAVVDGEIEGWEKP